MMEHWGEIKDMMITNREKNSKGIQLLPSKLYKKRTLYQQDGGQRGCLNVKVKSLKQQEVNTVTTKMYKYRNSGVGILLRDKVLTVRAEKVKSSCLHRAEENGRGWGKRMQFLIYSVGG